MHSRSSPVIERVALRLQVGDALLQRLRPVGVRILCGKLRGDRVVRDQRRDERERTERAAGHRVIVAASLTNQPSARRALVG